VDPDLAEAPQECVTRFEVPTRIVHWALAGPFVVLLLSGLTNFVPRLKATQFGGERLFAWLHVVTGFGALAAVVLLVLPQLAQRSARADLREIARVGLDDYLWMQHQFLTAAGASSRAPAARKFNAGQKLNAAISLGATAALLGTGLILGINFVSKRVFTVAFVESVFPWHTWVALLFVPVLLGHLYLALLNPSTREALRAITMGCVRRSWAAQHHAAWLAETEAAGAAPNRAP
jgi:formate dehydrogenase subunit gamma